MLASKSKRLVCYATAIVLTPAVYAATRAAGANPLPYLFACAFIANAASFVLPISNPANLVVFGERMPHLFEWLRQFALPSVAAIVVTYVVLCLSQRHALAEENIASRVPHPRLGRGGRLTAIGIAAVGVVLLTASALDVQLGLPTFICGLVTASAVLALSRQSPWRVMKGISWSVLPLVAGLFVMVEALVKTGAIGHLSALLQAGVEKSPAQAAWGAGIVASVAGNIANNLPVGLAGSIAASDHLPAGPERDADRSRSRAQSFGNRVPRHNLVAGGVAAGKDRRHRVALPKNWCTGDAARGVRGGDLVNARSGKGQSYVTWQASGLPAAAES